ncbi:MAG: FmdB family zinc ribbon protein [Candidatus Neomarinimicrobiota bacterium]|nr:FmdB family zinc ribbon protein [Candidatus Neomarinimicrobiota bacterium]
MPTYDYNCTECGERFEHFQTMSSDPLKQRPGCKKEQCSVTRVISGGTGLIFKGSGFYLTDYTDKGKQKKPAEGEKPKSATEKKAAVKKEAKAENSPS